MSQRILIAGRDAEITETVQAPLRDAGFEVVAASDLDEPSAWLDQQPDLVLVDAVLPGTDGASVCQALRAAADPARLPLVLYGVDGADVDLAAVAQSGCDQVLEAPLDCERLLEVCRELLGVPAEATAVPAGGGDAVADDAVAVHADAKTVHADSEVASTSSAGDAVADPACPDDHLLEGETEVSDALGRFDSIIEPDRGAHAEALDRLRQAGSRGDFSHLLDDAASADPRHALDRDLPAREEKRTEAVAPVTTPDPVASSGDAGDDIVAHLDSLFGGSEPAAGPAAARSEAQAAERDVPAAPREHPTAPRAAVAKPQAPATDPEKPIDTPATVSSFIDMPGSDGADPIAGRMPRATRSTASSEASTPTATPTPKPAPTPTASRAPTSTSPPAVAPSKERSESPSSRSRDAASSTRPFVPPSVPSRGVARTPTMAPLRHSPRRGIGPLWYGLAAVLVLGLVGAWLAMGTHDSVPEGDASRATTIAEASGRTDASRPEPPSRRSPTTAPTSSSNGASIESDADAATFDAAPSAPHGTSVTTPATTKPAAATTKPAPAKPTPAATTTKPAPAKPTPAATTTKPAAAKPTPTATTAKPAPAKPEPVAATPTPSPTTSPVPPPPRPSAATPEPPAVETTPVTQPPVAPKPTVSAPAAQAPIVPKPAAQTVPAVPDRPEPRLVSRTEPAISRKGLKRVAGQSIVLRVLVNDSGGISRVVVDQGIPGSEAEAAAITAVLGWHYEPATRDGAPVESWTTARFDFD